MAHVQVPYWQPDPDFLDSEEGHAALLAARLASLPRRLVPKVAVASTQLKSPFSASLLGPAARAPLPWPHQRAAKIAVLGRANSGKTASVLHFCGLPSTSNSSDYTETRGIRVRSCWWPLQILDGPRWQLKFSFWDCGFASAASYPYIVEDMLRDADAVLYVCSASDAASVEYTEQLLRENAAMAPVHVILLAKDDVWEQRQVTRKELEGLGGVERVLVFPIANPETPAASISASPDVRAVLDRLGVEILRARVDASEWEHGDPLAQQGDDEDENNDAA